MSLRRFRVPQEPFPGGLRSLGRFKLEFKAPVAPLGVWGFLGHPIPGGVSGAWLASREERDALDAPAAASLVKCNPELVISTLGSWWQLAHSEGFHFRRSLNPKAKGCGWTGVGRF